LLVAGQAGCIPLLGNDLPCEEPLQPVAHPERKPSIARMLAENRGPRQGTMTWSPIPPGVVSNATPGPTGLTFHLHDLGPARESADESLCHKFQMEAVVDFRTADGLLDETWRTTIFVNHKDLPFVQVDFLDVMPLRGRLQIEGLGPKINFLGVRLDLGEGGSGVLLASVTRADKVIERTVLATWEAPPPADP